MGRRSFGGRRSYSTGKKWSKWSSKKSYPKPAKTEDEKTPPSEKNTHVVSNSGGFGSSIADGFHWGIGNVMGHRFFEAIFGPRTVRQEIVVPDEKVKEVAIVSAEDDNEKFKDYTEISFLNMRYQL